MKRFTGHKEEWGTFLDVKHWPEIKNPKKYAGQRVVIGSVTDLSLIHIQMCIRDRLEGSYVLGINMMSDGLDNENTRNKLKELALDDSETNETNLMKTDISFRLYVSETDYPLVSYAKKLCDRLKQAGFSVDLKEYSNTMMLSRVVSGKYDVFLASDDFIDVKTLTQMDYMIMRCV